MGHNLVVSRFRHKLMTTLGLLTAITVVFAGNANGDPYTSTGQDGNLVISSGTLTIDTTNMRISGAGPVRNGRDDGGICVFDFVNIDIGPAVTVNVSGSRPLSLAATGDIYVGTNFLVPPGQFGGGGGGVAGGGGTGTVGGSGGTGVAGGPGGSGGAGGTGTGNGAGGTAGYGGDDYNGLPGAAASTAGGSGVAGVAGGLGFNAGSGNGAGGAHGEGGTPQSSANGGLGGRSAGGPGGGGIAGLTTCTSGGSGSGGANGGDGTQGQTGGAGDAGDPGGAAAYPGLPANTLTVFAGSGGGGGGGGGGGAGGQGGGAGGGGQGGGGGGGGGANWFYWDGCTFSSGSGGAGGHGGQGEAGGSGGAGGTGGIGGAGGHGQSGGGAIVLAARGLVEWTAPAQIDVSAGTDRTAGAGGTAGTSGTNGSAGGTGGASGRTNGGGGTQGAAIICCCYYLLPGPVGCAGGDGAYGGAGGTGGKGGDGGTGGKGGDGGYGVPGMVKLHGSVLLADDLTVVADNRYDPGTASTDYQGKLTFISNMNATAVNDHLPLLSNPSNANRVHVGVTSNDALLKDDSIYAGAAVQCPLVPELTTGPAVAGLLKPGYWNQDVVDSAAPIQTKNGCELYLLSGASSVYDGFDQVVVKNVSGGAVVGMFLQVVGYPPVLINTTGDLAAGDVWTTTIESGLGGLPLLVQGATITSHPQNADRWPGAASVRFSVTAVGDVPLTYQWYRDWDTDGDPDPGEEIGGATSPDLNLYNVQESDQGYYLCTVTNVARTVKSNPAFLNIFDGPTIVVHPVPLAKWPNESAQFAVLATGPGLSYQWQFQHGSAGDWENLPLAITATLDIDPVQESHEGDYRCVVSNPVDTVTSNPATLTVKDLPQIVKHPDDVTAPVGTPNIFFSIIATGTSLDYRWETNRTGVWEIIAGETANTLVIPFMQASDVGQYRCRVANGGLPYDDSSGLGGGVLSNEATLSAGDPGILQQPQSLTVNPLDPASFTVVPVTAGDPADLTYQWYKDEAAITLAQNPTAQSQTLDIAQAVEADEGGYKVRIDGPGGYVVSSTATLSVNDLPEITQQPQDLRVDIGDPASFTIVVESPMPVNYQWRYTDPVSLLTTNILDATDATYSIPSATEDHDGLYDCAVTSAATVNTGPVVSERAQLVVGHVLEITALSGGGAVYVGDPISFSITTRYGLGTRTYQWYKDDAPVGPSAQSTAETYTFDAIVIASADFAHAGTYVCKISDDRGTTVSESLQVEVFAHLSKPEILAKVNGVVVEERPVNSTVGDTVELRATVTGGIPPLDHDWLFEPDSGVKTLPDSWTVDGAEISVEDIEPEDEGWYAVAIGDSGTDLQVSDGIFISVDLGLPVGGLIGLVGLSAACSLAGLVMLRRRR